jgi:hypothetical protein
MAQAQAILDTLRSQIDLTDYKKLHWEGTFDQYLELVLAHPAVTRTAFQRLYDMILSHGTDDVYENKDKLTRSSSSPSSPPATPTASTASTGRSCNWSTRSSRPPSGTGPSGG